MSLSKKIFITSSVLLAIVLIFWGIYNFSFSAKEELSSVSPSTSSTVKPVGNSNSQILQISEEAVLAPFIDLKNSVIKYYAKETGKVYQIDFDGKNKKTVSDKSLSGLTNIVWSPDGTKVISKIIQNGIIKSYYYDYATSRGVPLRDNLDSIVWQNNNKIFYRYYDQTSKKTSLNISNPDGSDWAKITDLNYKDVSIAPIPRTGLVSSWSRPHAFYETDFNSALVIGGENKPIFREKFGADYLWNSNGSYALLSHSDQKNGAQIQLSVINSKGGEYKNLDIPTFVSKCTWSKDNKTIYYALPENMPSNMILPNDYQDKKFTTRDSFWKLNTVTGEKAILAGTDKAPTNIDASTLFLNADESMLFFINQLDNKLYRIDL